MIKILFYTSIPRSFRTTLIGHLYEICQKYPTVLLAEELSPDVKKILEDKSLFPNLKDIIPVNQFTGPEESAIKKYRRLRLLAKKMISDHQPSLVITANDLYPFEMYLFRYAKKIGAITVCIQPGMMIRSTVVKKWIDLTNAYTKIPRFIPLLLKRWLIYFRKYSGYLLYHWLAPLLVGEAPFPGKRSIMLGTTASGARATDYQVVFSERDHHIHLEEGVPEAKLVILAHPITREPRKIFNILLQMPGDTVKKRNKTACLMLPSEISVGFRRENLSLISQRQYKRIWLEIIKLTSASLPAWDIYVKPHPSGGNLTSIQKELAKFSKRIKLASPREPAEKYIKIADMIIGLPPSASTTLFIASLQRPDLPIISIDTERELLGDYYKNFPGIDYVTTGGELEKKLKLIASDKYEKEASPPAGGLTEEGFKNTIELIHYVTDQNPSHSRPGLTQ